MRSILVFSRVAFVFFGMVSALALAAEPPAKARAQARAEMISLCTKIKKLRVDSIDNPKLSELWQQLGRTAEMKKIFETLTASNPEQRVPMLEKTYLDLGVKTKECWPLTRLYRVAKKNRS